MCGTVQCMMSGHCGHYGQCEPGTGALLARLLIGLGWAGLGWPGLR